MKITPLQEEILEKLYIKAYVSEKTAENQAKYIDFIDNTIKIDEYQEIKNAVSRTYLSYWLISFVCLVVYSWEHIIFIDPTPDQRMYLLYIFGLSCGISLLLGYFRNRKSRKILKWMKPYIENKILEQFHEYEEKDKKREEWRAQRDAELREKYLTENATKPIVLASNDGNIGTGPKCEKFVVPQEWIDHAYPLKRITIELQGTRHSSLDSMLSQLKKVEERIKEGQECGEASDDDFGYKFAVSSPVESLFPEPFSCK